MNTVIPKTRGTFTGSENELKEGCYILFKLNEALEDHQRTGNKAEREKVERWQQRAAEWVKQNIKK